jgi:hypothetical protein
MLNPPWRTPLGDRNCGTHLGDALWGKVLLNPPAVLSWGPPLGNALEFPNLGDGHWGNPFGYLPWGIPLEETHWRTPLVGPHLVETP